MRIFMKLSKKYYKRHAEEAPTGDVGAVSSGVGGTSPAPAEAPSTTVDGVDSKTGEDVALRSQLREAAQAMKDKYAPKEEPGEPEAPRKPGETPLHDAAQMSAPTEAPAIPEGTTTPDAQPEPAKEPEVAKVEEPVAVPMIKVGNDEYQPKEIESIVEFAKKADAYLKTEKSTFDSRVAKLKEQESSFAEREAKIQERLTSPDVVLLDILAKNPELRDKFYAMACEADPEIEGKYNHAKSSQTIEQLQKKIEALEANFNGRVQSEETRAQKQQQEFQQAQVNRVVEDITAFQKEQATKFGIDAEYSQMIEHDAAERIKRGQLARDPQAIKDYILSRYQKLDSDFKAREARARDAYLGEKRNLPPPPPTGGGATRVSPPRLKTFADAEASLQSRINALKT